MFFPQVALSRKKKNKVPGQKILLLKTAKDYKDC